MSYKPFRVDKDILGMIYEKEGEELDKIVPIAFGENLLHKGIEEVTEEEIEIFVNYQKTLQIVNQFFGNIPIQPENFDIKELVIDSLKENSLKRMQSVKEQKSLQKIKKQPVGGIWMSPKVRELQRIVLHAYVTGTIHFPSETEVAECLDKIAEMGRKL